VTAACFGEQLTALVDGALSHTERDRVHAHLAGCPGCRAEVEAQRALKATLSGLAGSTPPPPDALLGALRALAVPGIEPGASRAPLPVGPDRPGASRPRGERPSGPLRPAAGPGRARRRSRLRRTSTVGGGLLVLGVGVALMLGGPAAPASTPVDPGSDAFVVDFVSTTSEVPLADPAGAAVSLPRR
jgi:anti-sigma factor RsiW